jgi:hypothetical protein
LNIFHKCFSNRANDHFILLYVSQFLQKAKAHLLIQSPSSNSKPFMSDGHLKILFSMFFFGSLLIQYGTKLVELDIKSTTIRKKIQ